MTKSAVFCGKLYFCAVEDLHWFCGKRTFIDGSVYMRFNGGVGFRVTSSLLI